MFAVIGLVAWAIIGLPAVQSLSRPSDYPASAQSSEKPSNSSQSQEPWLTKDAAGFFTFLLVVVGAAQVGLFLWQLWLIRESLDDAKIAATAAKQAAYAAKEQATAIVNAERPYLSILFKNTGLGLQPVSDKIYFQGQFVFDLLNHGKTVAILNEFCEEYAIIDGFEKGPDPIDPYQKRGRLLPVGTVSAPGFPATFPRDLIGVAHLAGNLSAPNFRFKKRLFFYGYIRFSDQFGSRYIVGFLGLYLPDQNRWVLRGDERYTYQRQEEADAIPPHPDQHV
jgi:hypothetical protein